MYITQNSASGRKVSPTQSFAHRGDHSFGQREEYLQNTCTQTMVTNKHTKEFTRKLFKTLAFTLQNNDAPTETPYNI